jgi:hypothetical protein
MPSVVYTERLVFIIILSNVMLTVKTLHSNGKRFIKGEQSSLIFTFNIGSTQVDFQEN